jgi:hypothetical protein
MPYKPKKNLDDVHTLADIFEEIKVLFDAIIEDDIWNKTLFTTGENDDEGKQKIILLKAAWKELKDESFDEIYNQLKNPTKELIFKLQQVGLEENQAQFKVKRFGLISSWKSFITNPTVKLLEILLKWLNKLLASLAKVIFHVDAWKEIKEVIEGFIAKSKDLADFPLTP